MNTSRECLFVYRLQCAHKVLYNIRTHTWLDNHTHMILLQYKTRIRTRRSTGCTLYRPHSTHQATHCIEMCASYAMRLDLSDQSGVFRARERANMIDPRARTAQVRHTDFALDPVGRRFETNDMRRMKIKSKYPFKAKATERERHVGENHQY